MKKTIPARLFTGILLMLVISACADTAEDTSLPMPESELTEMPESEQIGKAALAAWDAAEKWVAERAKNPREESEMVAEAE